MKAVYSSVSVNFLTNLFVTLDGCKVDIEFVFGGSLRLTFVITWVVMGLLSKRNDALCRGTERNFIIMQTSQEGVGEVKWVSESRNY